MHNILSVSVEPLFGFKTILLGSDVFTTSVDNYASYSPQDIGPIAAGNKYITYYIKYAGVYPERSRILPPTSAFHVEVKM
jgi:hypothetical protein